MAMVLICLAAVSIGLAAVGVVMEIIRECSQRYQDWEKKQIEELEQYRTTSDE